MNDIYNRDKIIKISINKIEKCGEIIFKKKTFWHKAHYEIYAPLSMRKYIDSDWIFPTNDPINKLIEDKLDLNVCFIKDNYIYCKASVEINFVDVRGQGLAAYGPTMGDNKSPYSWFFLMT